MRRVASFLVCGVTLLGGCKQRLIYEPVADFRSEPIGGTGSTKPPPPAPPVERIHGGII